MEERAQSSPQLKLLRLVGEVAQRVRGVSRPRCIMLDKRSVTPLGCELPSGVATTPTPPLYVGKQETDSGPKCTFSFRENYKKLF